VLVEGPPGTVVVVEALATDVVEDSDPRVVELPATDVDAPDGSVVDGPGSCSLMILVDTTPDDSSTRVMFTNATMPHRPITKPHASDKGVPS
jgi:hypothetical protein